MPNPTLIKFGYPDTLIKAFGDWAVLVRPAQVTLGSLVLAHQGDATAYSQLPDEAWSDQAAAVRAIESALRRFCDYERLNYLMLMMVDPNVHFHVIPRYSTPRSWENCQFPDEGWPGPPQLKSGHSLDERQIATMRDQLNRLF